MSGQARRKTRSRVIAAFGSPGSGTVLGNLCVGVQGPTSLDARWIRALQPHRVYRVIPADESYSSAELDAVDLAINAAMQQSDVSPMSSTTYDYAYNRVDICDGNFCFG
jgi:hypothetical protein